MKDKPIGIVGIGAMKVLEEVGGMNEIERIIDCVQKDAIKCSSDKEMIADDRKHYVKDISDHVTKSRIEGLEEILLYPKGLYYNQIVKSIAELKKSLKGDKE